jgi:hypothetical protein
VTADETKEVVKDPQAEEIAGIDKLKTAALREILRGFSGKTKKKDGKDAQLTKEEKVRTEVDWSQMKSSLGKVFAMVGGWRMAALLFFFSVASHYFGHKIVKNSTNWAKVKPENQLEELPKHIKLILYATIINSVFNMTKQFIYDMFKREISRKAHALALNKVVHGSVNRYFDITPIG